MEFLIWGKYQSRAERLASYLDCNIHYIYSEKSILVRYFVSLITSLNIIFKSKSNHFIIQLPPNLIIYLIPFIKMFKKSSKIILDMHNGATRGSWGKLPFIWKIINKYSDLVIVHNEDYFNELISTGKLTTKFIEVLPDPPAEKNSSNIELNNSDLLKKGEVNILIPCSYNPDEPILELIELAKMKPEFHLILTGNKNKALKILGDTDIPKNITFSGFISADEYKYLFLNAEVIMGLTKNENIQLSVSTESLSFGKPAILSDTKTLRKLYPNGYIFTDNSPNNMKKSIIQYLNEVSKLNEDLNEVRQEKIINWNIKLKNLRGEYNL
ncbi:glycosyltransferase [Metabacillus idriensis]|uniref:glycosyltransferase n=1 Tax=Metabacillus idriensis TaxID=324768 RepID=UPI00174A7A06|nr:glycosyltransferase [Metabacillus idriensis]